MAYSTKMPARELSLVACDGRISAIYGRSFSEWWGSKYVLSQSCDLHQGSEHGVSLLQRPRVDLCFDPSLISRPVVRWTASLGRSDWSIAC